MSKRSKKDWLKQKPVPFAGSGGAMGKGGGGGGSTAEEDADTLVSRSYARIVDILSEGPIGGWTNPTFPLKDVRLDGTVVQNNDAWGVSTHGQTSLGSRVFTDNTINFPFRQGEPTKSQIVGRWITGTNIPAFTTVVSVEDAHHLTMSAAATSSASNLTWQLGGSLNFKNFQFQFRTGTQSQTAMVGYPASEVTTAVGVRVTQSGSPGEWSSPSFTDPIIDAIRVDMRFPRLQEQDTSTGDVHGTSVHLKIYANNQVVVDDTVTGKASSAYLRTYQIEMTGRSFPMQIRVQRITLDSHSQALANETWVDSYTEVVYGKLRHPNTAMVGLRVSAEQFQQIPTRAYHIKGLIVKIPSNYNPVTRVYTGIWNGTFTSAWTDNPAWCFYDMCTNGRYGLGNQLVEANIDKWTLYTIAQYCDEMVNDGYGGTEPRFRCNLYIQRHEDAIKVLQDMAGIFRGMLAYVNGTITPVQDAPQPTAVYKMFSPVNVINGVFSYSGTALRARHNVAVVSYADQADGGDIKQEYVEDHEGITESGAINQLELTGFGTTSRGEARRRGLWSVFAEKILTDTVAFSTGLEGYFVPPGGLIAVQDPFRAGVPFSGRLVAGSTATHLLLDRSVTIIGGHTYAVSLINPSTNVLTTKAVTQGAGTWSDITVTTFGFTPEVGSVWMMADIDVVEPDLYRVFSAVVKEANILEMTAIKYNQSLYDFVDFGYPLDEPPISILPGATQTLPPTNLLLAVIQTIMPGNVIMQSLEAGWDASPDPYLARYKVRYRRDQSNWTEWADSPVNSFTWTNVQPGDYEVQVEAVNMIGIASEALDGEITIDAPPTNITGVTGLELFDAGNDNLFQTRDAHFIWRVAGDSGVGQGPSFPGSGVNDNKDPGVPVGVPDAMAVGFDVTFWNDETVLWQDRTVNSEYIYTWEKNKERAEAIYGAGTPPFRIFRCEVRVIFQDNTLSAAAKLTVENPAPNPPTSVVLTQGNGFVSVQWVPPTDPDIDHYALYASSDPDDDNPPWVADFYGTSGTYFYQAGHAGDSYWLASVDTFGTPSTNIPNGPPPGGIVQVPVFDPAAGSITGLVSVAITEATPNCTIYYSNVLPGAAPGTWTVYTTPIAIASSRRIYAVAVSNDDPTQTAAAVADYTLGGIATPQFDPKGGYFTTQTGRLNPPLEIQTTTGGAWLFYTTDGTTPAHDPSGVPTGTTTRVQRTSIFVDVTEGLTTVKALAWKSGLGDSAIMTQVYHVNLIQSGICATPTYSPAEGPCTFPVTVQLNSSSPADCKIEYTKNGLIPPLPNGTHTNNHNSIILSGPGPVYLKSIAYRRGYYRSALKVGKFYSSLPAPPPALSPAPGEFTTFPINVAVKAMSGQMRYTLDGSNPSSLSGTLIAGTSGTVLVTTPGQMLRVVAIPGGASDVSPIAGGIYSGKITTPTHTPADVTYAPGNTLNVDIDVYAAPTKGLAGWWKADSIAQGDATPVGSWADSSGNGFTATQAGAARPTFKTNIIGSLPVVRFDGVNDSMLTSAALGLNQPNTIIVFAKQTSTATQGRFVDSIILGARQLLGLNTSGFFDMYSGASLNDAVNHSGGFHVLSGVFNGASSKGYIDGILAVSGNPGSNPPGQIGFGSDGASAFLTGDIAEILIYDRALSDDERRQVEEYLTIKYSLSPPTINARYTTDGTTPTKTSGTLVTSFPTTVPISGGFRELRTIAFQVSPVPVWKDSSVLLSTYDWETPTWQGGS